MVGPEPLERLVSQQTILGTAAPSQPDCSLQRSGRAPTKWAMPCMPSDPILSPAHLAADRRRKQDRLRPPEKPPRVRCPVCHQPFVEIALPPQHVARKMHLQKPDPRLISVQTKHTNCYQWKLIESITDEQPVSISSFTACQRALNKHPVTQPFALSNEQLNHQLLIVTGRCWLSRPRSRSNTLSRSVASAAAMFTNLQEVQRLEQRQGAQARGPHHTIHTDPLGRPIGLSTLDLVHCTFRHRCTLDLSADTAGPPIPCTWQCPICKVEATPAQGLGLGCPLSDSAGVCRYVIHQGHCSSHPIRQPRTPFFSRVECCNLL